MGFIEEGRQLIQDFVTPEIRSIDTRLSAVEKRLESIDIKVEKLEIKVDNRIDSLEARMERNQAQIMDALHSVERYTQLAERLARVESKLQNVA
jgi:predicted  nucleic acid-binding Zn-ribbon protein